MEKLIEYLKSAKPKSLSFRGTLDKAEELGWHLPNPIQLFEAMETAGYHYVGGSADVFLLAEPSTP